MTTTKNKRTILRDDAGRPFSKWKPAEKFEHVLRAHFPNFARHCETEVTFDAARDWRFDFAWPTERVAVEIDGFGFGHQAQQRISQNNEKQNAAVAQGWRVLRFDSRLLGSMAKVVDAATLTCEVLCGVET